jgi:hypothetical protein
MDFLFFLQYCRWKENNFIRSGKLIKEHGTMTTSSISPANTPPAPAPARRFSLDRFSLDSWAVAAALIFIVLIVAGIFPRVPW